MNTYDIFVEICLGMSHCGAITTCGKSQISLTDAQVATLKKIMDTAYAEGIDLEELDLQDTDLEETDSNLYKLLYDAYYECAYQAEYHYWTARYGEGSDMEDFEFESPILIPPSLIKEFLSTKSNSAHLDGHQG